MFDMAITACPHLQPNSYRQVALNQLCLAPITISVVFTWNLALTGQLDQLPGKPAAVCWLLSTPAMRLRPSAQHQTGCLTGTALLP